MEMQSVSKVSLNESGPVRLGQWSGKGRLPWRGKTFEMMLNIEKEPAM